MPRRRGCDGLRDRLQASLMRRVPGLRLNGDTEHRLPGNLNLSFPGLTAPELIAACPTVAMSTGSACTSASVEPSYVLRALGLRMRWRMPRSGSVSDASRPRTRLISRPTRWPPPPPGCTPSTASTG